MTSHVTGGFLHGQRRSPTWVRDALDGLLPLLGQELVGPLAARLAQLPVPTSGVTLVAGSPLGSVPLRAAMYTVDGMTHRLLDDFDVSYAPSAGVLNAAGAALRDRS